MRVGSLFSGIGGLDLGLERSGMTIAWHSEIDPYCSEILKQQWPGVPNYGDITQMRVEDVEPVDLLCGGFPCQPVSIAGRRKAQEDARWLWPEFARLVRGLRPEYVLVENVPGLLSRGFGDVLGDLAACGYDAEWDCIPAAAFGAPHLRYRVILVAYPTDNRRVEGGTGTPELLRQPGCRGDAAPLLDDPGGRRHRPPQGEVFAGGYGPEHASWWDAEPDVGRVANGVPARVDRLRALGNAVVPQVAEWVGRQIMAHAQHLEGAA